MPRGCRILQVVVGFAASAVLREVIQVGTRDVRPQIRHRSSRIIIVLAERLSGLRRGAGIIRRRMRRFAYRRLELR